MLTTHCKKRARECGRVIGRKPNLLKAVANLFTGRCARQRKRGVSVNRHQNVVEVVRDSTSKLAHKLHLLNLAQFFFELSLFRHLAAQSRRELAQITIGRLLRLKENEKITARIMRWEVLHRQAQCRKVGDVRKPRPADEKQSISAVITMNAHELTTQLEERPLRKRQHKNRAIVRGNRIKLSDVRRTIDDHVVRKRRANFQLR